MKSRFIKSGISYSDSLPTFGNDIVEESPQKSIYGNPFTAVTSGDKLNKDIVALESGGNYRAFNPDGGGEGAVGKYQFRWKAHKDKIRNYANNPNLSKEDFRNNPQLQDGFFDNYWKPKVLRPDAMDIERRYKTGLPVDKLEKLVHFRGKQGAEDYLQGVVSDKPESYNMSISGYTGIKRSNLKLPKLNMGGVISAFGAVMQPISELVEGDGTDPYRSAAAGFLQSGVIGAVSKGLQAKKALDLKEGRERVSRFNSLPNSQGSYQQLNLNPNIGYYAKGGLMKPQYEAERGEVAIGDAQLEDSTELAPGVHKVGGQSHENGGTLGQGGEFMFSNKVMLDNAGLQLLNYLGIPSKDNMSFSDAATLIGKEKGKYSFASNRYRENNTNKMMSMRFDAGLAQLAQLQEQLKQQ